MFNDNDAAEVVENVIKNVCKDNNIAKIAKASKQSKDVFKLNKEASSSNCEKGAKFINLVFKEHMTGKECREQLCIPKDRPTRLVPAFTYQALQKNTEVIPPKKINLFKSRPQAKTYFKTYLMRGDIPIASSGKIIHTKKGKEFPVRWLCKPQDIDYCYYLPIFFDGLGDSDPYIRKLAICGAMDMINRAPHKVVATLPKLILPLKRAFNTRNKDIIVSALKVIQSMVLVAPCVGPSLVPFYRQLLAVCNLYKNINVNLGAGIDTNRNGRIGDVIEDTLHILERCGGQNAFINIKYMVPTYESNIYPRSENNESKPVPQK